MPRRRRRVSLSVPLVLGALVAGLPVVGAIGDRAPAAAAGVATTAYEPLQPCRLVDTRAGAGYVALDGRTLRIPTDVCGIPDGAAALVVTTTIIRPTVSGHLVTYPGGTPRPHAATLTWRPGTTRANSATVRVGNDGTIELFRSDGFVAGNVTVDVVGAFVPAETANAGRFVPLPGGRRLVDTRSDAPLDAAGSIRVALPDDVPDDVGALAVTVTAANSGGRGFFTANPAGTERPTTSVLNVDQAGQFRAAATFVPVNADGFDLYSSSGGDVIVDLSGWFTGESGEDAADGLFVPTEPVRLADTRPEPRPIHPDGTIEVPLPAGLTDSVQPGPPSALSLSLTMVDPDHRGYITAHAARAPRGPTSSGFALAGEVAAQFTVAPTSGAGVAVYSSNGTELTADLLGWFTGASVPMTEPTPTNPVPPQRVLAIGDSSLAGIDRTNAHRALQGAVFDLRARSCRRLVRPSCTGQEGPIPPPTALETLRSIPDDAYDVVVVMTGYNDVMPTFPAHVAQVAQEARARGIRRVIWLTMAREFRSDKGGAASFQVYSAHNEAIRAIAAAQHWMIAPEWSSLARQMPNWTYPDGIHLAPGGGLAAADLISRAVAHVTGQACPMPAFVGDPNLGVCRDPSFLPPVDVAALYGR